MKTQKIPSGFLSIFLKKDYTVSNSERASRVKENICNGLLISLAVMAIPALIGNLSRAFETGLKPAMFIQAFIAMSIWVAVFIRKRLSYLFRARLLIFALYFVSLTGFLQFGLLAPAGAWFIIIPALSVILFNIRTGLAMTLIIFISFVVITTLTVKGFIVYDFNVSEYITSLSSWANFSLTYLLGSVLVYTAISISTNSLMNTVSETDDIAKDLEQLIETANNPILEFDTEGKINVWNKTFEKITGFKKSEVLGQDFVEIFITEDYKKSVKQVLGDALKGEETTNFEFPFFTKEGSRVIILLNSSTRKNINGEIVGVLGVGQDITEQKQASQYARSLIEASLDPLVTISAEGKITDVNEASEKVTGVTREELIGTDFSNYFIDSKKAQEGYLQVFDQGFVTDYPLTIKNKNGNLTDVLYNASVYKDDKGNVLGVFASARDVTEQKQASEYALSLIEALRVSEEDLQNINVELEVRSAKDLIASENRFRSLFENATQCMLVVDLKLEKIINANKSALALFKYSKDDLFKMGPREISPKWQPDGIASDTQIRASIEQVLKGENVSREWWLIDAHGGDIQAELSINLLSETDISQVVVNIIDVTEKNRIKDELAYQNEEKDRRAAELAVVNKELVFQNEENTKRTAELEEFTYVASHDLQEPVRTISSFVNLFRENYADKLDDEAKQYLDFMDGASQRSQQLIVDLLDYSRLDENRETEQVNLNQVLEYVLVDLTVRIKESGAIVTVDKLPTIEGQLTNLRLLFQNLISNAIKFHKKDILPKVHISVSPVDNEYVFSISDNGIGIEEKYMGRIFVIFKRLHGKSDYEGTGIGLAHCKKIVELHNGRIWVESELEKGSTFLIAIPIEVEI